MKLVAIFGSFVVTLASLGCATATGNPTTTTEDAGQQASKDAGKDSASTKKPADSGTPTNDSGGSQNDSGAPPDDTTCAAETSKATCEQCCLTVHPAGYDVYHQALQQCACTSPAACASECATELCNNKATTSGGACATCVTASLTQNTGACYNAVGTACQGDVDCTALFGTCIPPCESK